MDNILQIVCTILITAVGSSGLWGFMQYKADKKDKTADLLKKIDNKIEELSEELQDTKANLARRNILSLNDDIETGIWHSRDYYRTVIEEDIPKYNRHCETHPNYENGFTSEAVLTIKQKYHKSIENGEFKEVQK